MSAKESHAMSEQLWTNAALTVVNAGQIPIPITPTLLELMRTIMNAEQAEFIQIFTKPLNIDDIRERTALDEPSIDRILKELMDNGILTGIPSRTTGTMVYRLLPPIPGIFEFTLIRGLSGAKEKKIAGLFDALSEELTAIVQGNYNDSVEIFKAIPPLTRVVPVERQIALGGGDAILPSDEVKRIIDKFDTIAVVHCYCRHEKDLLGRPCKVTHEKRNCLAFGQIARFIIDYRFGEEISRQEAKRILDETEEAGLVHKAFHDKDDIHRDEVAICNCCKCCCGTFELYYRGGAPVNTYTSYRAAVNPDACTACALCVERCPMEAIRLTGLDEAGIVEDRCIGCGVCAHHCPSHAIRMERTGVREVFIAPPRTP
ncbi:MAG TPA: 4Fe-4S binding protein [Deltaproteobacteria bacterium]|nr:4Fe-4S binding protein [Deltaproteobacteria bacterium]